MITRKFRYVFPTAMLLVIGYCLWGLIVDGLELRKAQAEQKWLEKLVGRLDIRDPSKIALISIEHSKPADLAWRIYLPEGVAFSTKYQMVVGGGGSSSSPARQSSIDLLVRCRLLKDKDTWRLYVARSMGSSVNSLPSDIGEFIQRHWNELTISIAGKDEQLNVNSTRVITLLSIDVPEKVMPHAKKELSDYVLKRLKSRPLLLLEIGSQKAFQAREKALNTSGEVNDHG